MDTVLSRYRNLIVLALVLCTQVVGLAVQVKRSVDHEPTRLVRFWSVSAITPLEKALVAVQTRFRELWTSYLDLRGVRQQNESLKAQIEQMQLEQVRLGEDARQARRLQVLLGFKEQYLSQTVAAQVVGSSGSEQSRAVYIDKGQHDGIRPDMPVMTADGVVGKILRVYPGTAELLLLNDQTSGVGAILESSRLQGVIRGTPSGGVVMEKVMADENVQSGDRVLTSGGDRIFPKGLPIGTVSKSSPGAELFLNIQVKPAANLARLEEVLVVTKIEEKAPLPEETGPVRAIDILAQRLPSVPPKAQANPPAGQPKQTTSEGLSGSRSAAVVPGNAAKATKPNSAGALTGMTGTEGRATGAAKEPPSRPGVATGGNTANPRRATPGLGASARTQGTNPASATSTATVKTGSKPSASAPDSAPPGGATENEPPNETYIAPDTVTHPGQKQKSEVKPVPPSANPSEGAEPGPQ